jgi:hypothetical protein
MANRRMLNSDLFSDDVFMELDDLTRLVWIGLIVMSADDQGRLQDNELLIKSQIFPMDCKSPAKVKSSLDTLEHHNMIHRYQKGDKNLIQIVNWWKHQSPSWASASTYPAPDNWIDREKYHAIGNKVVTTNWDTSGGFDNLHSILHSQLPTGVSRLIDESDVKSDVKSESDVDSFVAVYVDQTGLKPKKTKEEVETINRLIGLGVTPEEYRRAIQEMQAKPYKIASMKSPETWVVNNHNGHKQAGADIEHFRKLYREQKRGAA